METCDIFGIGIVVVYNNCHAAAQGRTRTEIFTAKMFCDPEIRLVMKANERIRANTRKYQHIFCFLNENNLFVLKGNAYLWYFIGTCSCTD